MAPIRSFNNLIAPTPNAGVPQQIVDVAYVNPAISTFVSQFVGQIDVAPSGDVSGATDVTNINNAIASAAAKGWRYVKLAQGNFTISSSIAMSHSNVSLIGIGSVGLGLNTVINSLVNGPAILVQTTGGLMQGWVVSQMQIITPSGASATSAIGIKVDSSQYGVLDHLLLSINGDRQIGLSFDPQQGFNAENTRTDSVDIGLDPGAHTAIALSLNGATAGNAFTTENSFIDLQISCGTFTQTGMYLGICDTNVFVNTLVFGPGSGVTAPTIINFDYGARGAAFPTDPNSNAFFGTDFGFNVNWSTPANNIINSGTPSVFGAPNTFYSYGSGDGAVAVALSNVEYYGVRNVLVGTLGRIGFTKGAGATTTQSSSITTAVTINNNCGQITTVSNSWTAGTAAAFTVNNSVVLANDVVICSQQGNPTNAFALSTWNTTNGSFNISIYPFSTVSTSVIINFAIIRAVNS